MAGYINVSQVGNKLYFDTKGQSRGGYYLHMYHSQIRKILEKFFMSYQQICFSTEVTMKGKTLAWSNCFGIKVSVASYIFFIYYYKHL